MLEMPIITEICWIDVVRQLVIGHIPVMMVADVMRFYVPRSQRSLKPIIVMVVDRSWGCGKVYYG